MVILLPQLPSKQRLIRKLYIKSIEALVFWRHGHRVPYNDYTYHYVLVSDLTNTQQASQFYLNPELTNGSTSISSRFSAQLTNSVELFLPGERSSTIYIDSSRKVSNNIFLNTKPENRR